MSKRPAPQDGPRRARRPASSALLALALLPAAWAAAGELGADVDFGNAGRAISVAVAPAAAGDIVYDSGESGRISEPWDTLLFQGVSPDFGVAFQASRRDALGRWSPWTPATIKRYSGGRFWAKVPMPPSAPGRVRIRAIAGAALAAHAIEVFTVEVFTQDAPVPFSQAPILSTGPAFPGLHGRAEWGARPPKQDYEPDAPYRLTLHHTSGLQTGTLADSLKEVSFIQDFHQNGRGWNDIAYHFLIDAAGRVFEGRPLGALGAHTLHNNIGNVGIVMLGTYHPPKNDQPTAAELDAFVSIGRFLKAVYGVDPATLRGHRDYKQTDCPGDVLYPLLGKLKTEIGKPSSGPILGVTPVGPGKVVVPVAVRPGL